MAEYQGKTVDYTKLYADVTMKMFRKNLDNNQVMDVETIIADNHDYDFDQVAPIAFSFLDVDLYRPMKRPINETYDRLSPGGVITCDDYTLRFDAHDGALQAYNEYLEERGLAPEIVEGCMGIVRR